MYSSFASALWCCGLHETALSVASEASSKSDGDPFSLNSLAVFIRNLGIWLTPTKIRNAQEFKLLEYDLSETIAVVVLNYSDGSCNHAISVHDGLILDSNEETAILLNPSNLDQLGATELKPANFAGIFSGYLFSDSRKNTRINEFKMESKFWKSGFVAL